jgi:hypothetical protein
VLLLRVRLLLATLWVGSLWTVGYLVAPTLFATLSDRVLAGTIAGSMFRIEAWLSIICGAVLIVLIQLTANREEAARRRSWTILIAAMLACTLTSHFGLQPYMAALRETAGAGAVMGPDARTQFGVLHGISSAIYLMESLLGAALILKLR